MFNHHIRLGKNLNVPLIQSLVIAQLRNLFKVALNERNDTKPSINYHHRFDSFFVSFLIRSLKEFPKFLRKRNFFFLYAFCTPIQKWICYTYILCAKVAILILFVYFSSWSVFFAVFCGSLLSSLSTCFFALLLFFVGMFHSTLVLNQFKLKFTHI